MLRAPLSDKKIGFIYAIIAAVAWGTYGTFIVLLGYVGIEGLVVVALAPSILVVFFLSRVLLTDPKKLIIDRRIFFILVAHGVILVTMQNYSYVRAVELIPVGIVSTIAFSHVFLLMITTRLVFKYPMTGVKIFAGFLAILGVGLVLDVFNMTAQRLDPVGVFWALLIPINYAIAYTLNKYYLEKGVCYDVIPIYSNLSSAIFLWFTISPLTMYSQVTNSAAVHGWLVWLAVLGFGFVPLITSYTFFLKAYEKIEPTFVSIMFSLEPMTAALLGYFIFYQKVGVVQIAGMLVILCSVIFSQYRELHRETEIMADQ